MTKQEEIVCAKCNKLKPPSKFYSSKINRSGYHWECKDCAKQVEKDRYARSDTMRIARLKYGRTDMARYTRLKSNAKRRGTEFLLDKLEFLIWLEKQERVCHYCGVSLNTNGGRASQLSVDRADNTIGYTLGNIVLCCQMCNTIKGNIFTEQEMVEIPDKYIKLKKLAM